MDALEKRIAARRVVDEQCYDEFTEIAEMLGGPYLVGGPLEVCSPERGELYRETMVRYRAAARAAWDSAV